MANKKFIYDIGFKVDKQGLKTAQQELQKISNMTLKDAKLIDASLTQAEFQKIKTSALELQTVLRNSFNEKLGTYNLKDLEKNLKNLKTPLDQTFLQMKKLGAEGVAAFRSTAAEILTANTHIKETSKLLESMGKTLGNTIKWSIASSVVNLFTGSVQKAWNYTQKLDESLNNIRIVTEKSNAEMEKFAKTANRAAKSLGASTTDYTNASLIYYQQGLGEKDVQARTKTTIKAANVTGQSAAEVSEQLTAVWNGYKVVAEEAEQYVDKLAAVAANTAADLEELSEGMSKVASAANAMGVDIDQLTAQIATIVSVTRQDASVVGTALKTIYSRMGDLKVDGIDEFGVTLGEVSGQLQQMGINVLDESGNLRDMGVVIEEVAAKWGTWTEAQQQAAAVAIAGKRQYNNLMALFENWSMYESSLSTSQNSEGTLQKQQEIYMDSLEAKLEKLRTATEKVWDSLINSEGTKTAIDMLASLISFVGDLVKGMGGLSGILLNVGGLLMKTFSGEIAQSVTRTLNNIKFSLRGIQEEAAKIDLQKKFGVTNDKGLEKMLQIQKDRFKYSKLLSEEEKKQLDTLTKQVAEAYNKLDLSKKQKKDLEDYYKKATGSDKKVNINNKTHRSAMANNLDISAAGLELLASDMGGKTGKQKQALDNSNPELKFKSIKQLSKIQKTASEQQASDIQEIIEWKQKENKIFQVAKTQNIDAYHKLCAASDQYKKGLIDGEQYTSILANTSRELAKETKSVADATRNYTDRSKEAQTEIDQLSKKYADLQRALKTKAVINNVTQVIGSVMQAVSVFQSLSNAVQIWTDDSATWGEKLSQTIGSIGSVAMSVVPTVISAAAAIKAGVDVALNWISLILTVVAAAAGLVTSVIKALPKNETELEKANKALEKAEERANAARETYAKLTEKLENLKTAIEDIDLQKLKIESLIPGTVEYTNAVAQLNSQILELVNLYPQLAQHLQFSNGMFSLSDGALEELQVATEQSVRNAQKNIIVSEGMLVQARNDNINAQFNDYKYWKNKSNQIDWNKVGQKVLSGAIGAGVLGSTMVAGVPGGELLVGHMLAKDLKNQKHGGSDDVLLDQGYTVEDLMRMDTEALLQFKDSLDGQSSTLEDAIDEIVEGRKQLELNNARLKELNRSYLKAAANDEGITTETGQEMFATLMNIVAPNGVIPNQNQMNDFYEDYGLDFLSTNGKNRVANGKTTNDGDAKYNKLGQKINEKEFGFIMDAFEEAVEDVGWEITNNATFGEINEGSKFTEDTMLAAEGVIAFNNGETMSLGSAFEAVAQERLYQDYKKKLDKISPNLPEKIIGAEQSDIGALAFTLSEEGDKVKYELDTIQAEGKRYQEMYELAHMTGKEAEEAGYTVREHIEAKNQWRDIEFGLVPMSDALRYATDESYRKTIDEAEELLFGEGITERVSLQTAKKAAKGGTFTWYEKDENGNIIDGTGEEVAYSKEKGEAYLKNFQREVYDNLGYTLATSKIWGPEGVFGSDITQNFNLSDFKNLGEAYGKNAQAILDALAINNAEQVKQIVSLIINDKTIRPTMTAALGLSAEFGQRRNKETGEWETLKGYTALDLREKVIDTYKQELDYAKKINQEIEHAFGQQKVALLNQSADMQKDAARRASDYYKFLAEGASEGLNKERFLNENGEFNYTGMLDYIAELRTLGEDNAMYMEAQEILAAYDEMIERAWGVIDSQVAAYNANLEYEQSVRELRDSFIGFKEEMASTSFEDWGNSSFVSMIGIAQQKMAASSSNYTADVNALQQIQGWLIGADGSGNTENNPFYNPETGEFSAESWSQAYNEAIETAHSSYSTLREEITDTFSLWNEGISQVQKAYDQTINKVKDLSDVTKNLIQLGSLVGNNIDNLGAYYDIMEDYSLATANYLNAKVTDLLTVYQEAVKTGNKELIESSKKALMDASKDVSQFAIDHLQLIQDKFNALTSNKVNDLLNSLGQTSLSSMSVEWSLETQKDETYLDEVNEQYARDELSRLFDRAINETDSMYAQNKLMEKRVEIEEELAIIKAKQGKLTQYDLDRANALYDLTLKQIALEEAQQTANKMKLVRDANGNYTYQYVQDQDAIADAKAELEAAQNDLYNLDKDRKKELVDDFFSMWTEYQEKMAEAMATGDKDLQQQVQDYYFGNNGLLKMLETQLSILGNGATGIAGSIADMFTESNLFNSLQTSIGEIFSTSSAEVTNLQTVLSGLSATLQNVADGMNNTTEFGEGWKEEFRTIASGIMNITVGDETVNAFSYLANVISTNITTLTDNATKLEQGYQNYIDSYTALGNAMNSNTLAVRDLTEVIKDGPVNGSLGGETGQATETYHP